MIALISSIIKLLYDFGYDLICIISTVTGLKYLTANMLFLIIIPTILIGMNTLVQKEDKIRLAIKINIIIIGIISIIVLYSLYFMWRAIWIGDVDIDPNIFL